MTMMNLSDTLDRGVEKLRLLYGGSRCLVQNQRGAHPRKWDRSGVKMEVLLHDQFKIIIDDLRKKKVSETTQSCFNQYLIKILPG